MLRLAFYPLYLFAPFILVYDSIFYPHFDLKKFLCFSAMVIAARSLAADAKDMVGAGAIRDEIGKIEVEFKQLKIATRLLNGRNREIVARLAEIATGSDRPSLLLYSVLFPTFIF